MNHPCIALAALVVKECKSQGINTTHSPKKCASDLHLQEQQLKSLLTSPRFLKLIQKLETTVSPTGSAIISSGAVEAKAPEATPREDHVSPKALSHHSDSSSNSEENTVSVSVKRSLKTISEKSSVGSVVLQAITVNSHKESNTPKSLNAGSDLSQITTVSLEKSFRKKPTSKQSSSRLGAESRKSPVASGKRHGLRKSTSDSGIFRKKKFCTKCVQTLLKPNQRKYTDARSSSASSNTSKKKTQNSSATSRNSSQISRINKGTSSTDLRRTIRRFTRSNSGSRSPSPKPKVPHQRKPTTRHSSSYSPTLPDANIASRLPVSKKETRRASPVNLKRTKPKEKSAPKKHNSLVPPSPAIPSIESGKFSVSALSPTPTPSNALTDASWSPRTKLKTKLKKTTSPNGKPQQKSSAASSIASSTVSKNLVTPALASPDDSVYSQISLSQNDKTPNILRGRNLDRKSSEKLDLKKLMQNRSVEYVYQNALRAEIELVDRRDSGSVATKLSARINPVPAPQADIYSTFYKSQIFDPNPKGRKPKRIEVFSPKMKNPQKGIQVGVQEGYPTIKAGKVSKSPSISDVQKGNGFVDVFKLLEETNSSADDLPTRQSGNAAWKSILKNSDRENKTNEKPNNRYWFKWRKKPRTESNNKKLSYQVKKPEGVPIKKGYLLRRLNTIYDNPKGLEGPQGSTLNSQLNLTVAPPSTAEILGSDQGTVPNVAGNKSPYGLAAAKRIPFSSEKRTNDAKATKRFRKAGLKALKSLTRHQR